MDWSHIQLLPAPAITTYMACYSIVLWAPPIASCTLHEVVHNVNSNHQSYSKSRHLANRGLAYVHASGLRG
ncbi:hypothetical protein C8Q73DRAFT_694191 [Cubamyces lactineus]|nr:hypothetical protein C8Q73DRAFT_694191 [Cubamyces lactineus]